MVVRKSFYCTTGSTTRTGTNRRHVLWFYFHISWIILAILSNSRECWCLRDVHLVILPPTVERGGSVLLLCQYDLEDAPLYSVSWYRGTFEFYRHSPNEIQTIKLFKVNGIHVDETLSNSTQVVLNNISFSLSGNFSCEVTTDAPFFSTQSGSSQLAVIELPETSPILMVERDRYTLGDTLRANCTSPPSRPPAELTFQVNGITVGVTAIIDHNNYEIDRLGWSRSTHHKTSQHWSTATLNLQLLPIHFGQTNSIVSSSSGQPSSSSSYLYSDMLKVTCTAHVTPGDFYRSTNVQLNTGIHGEPVHERVMSSSNNISSRSSSGGNTIALTITIPKTLLLIIPWVSITPTVWLYNNIVTIFQKYHRHQKQQ